jgi:hypothetical protein
MLFKEGDSIHMRNFKGTYRITWINQVRAQITCNKWEQDYRDGKRALPCQTVLVTDIHTLSNSNAPERIKEYTDEFLKQRNAATKS